MLVTLNQNALNCLSGKLHLWWSCAVDYAHGVSLLENNYITIQVDAPVNDTSGVWQKDKNRMVNASINWMGFSSVGFGFGRCNSDTFDITLTLRLWARWYVIRSDSRWEAKLSPLNPVLHSSAGHCHEVCPECSWLERLVRPGIQSFSAVPKFAVCLNQSFVIRS